MALKPLAGLRLFVRQDVQQRFAGNAVGVAWALVLPLLQLALFGLLFVQVFKARMPPDLENVSYLAFLALGMWPWFAFSEAVGRGAGALVENAGLLGKVAVPYWQLIVARVLVAFAIHGVGFLLVLAVLLAGGNALHWVWLPLLLAPWLLLLLLAVALASLLAVLQVFVRDIAQIAPYLLTALMFTAPILYLAQALPDSAQWWFQANPLALAISAIRDPLMRGVWPQDWGIALGVSALGCSFTFYLYRRLRAHIEDFL